MILLALRILPAVHTSRQVRYGAWTNSNSNAEYLSTHDIKLSLETNAASELISALFLNIKTNSLGKPGKAQWRAITRSNSMFVFLISAMVVDLSSSHVCFNLLLVGGSANQERGYRQSGAWRLLYYIITSWLNSYLICKLQDKQRIHFKIYCIIPLGRNKRLLLNSTIIWHPDLAV